MYFKIEKNVQILQEFSQIQNTLLLEFFKLYQRGSPYKQSYFFL